MPLKNLFKIKQLNAHKAIACHTFICHEMNNEKSIFLLQEPALIRGELRKYPKNYIMYGENKNCRATIVAPKS